MKLLLFGATGMVDLGALRHPERLGRAMLRVVQGRADRFILEAADISRIGV